MYLFPQFRMYRSFFQRFLYTMFNYFLRILLIFQIQSKFSYSRISQLLCVCDRYNSRSQIKRNVYFNMFRVTGSEIKIYMGVMQVSFEKMSVIMLLFVDIRIKTSKNGISILLLFMVKRIWSFKELSSV